MHDKTTRTQNPVPGIQNPLYGIQNPRLFWIPLHGAECGLLCSVDSLLAGYPILYIFRSIRILDYLIIEINVQALLKIFLWFLGQ